MSKSLISKINSNICRMELNELELHASKKAIGSGVDSYKEMLLMRFEQKLVENLKEVKSFSPFLITVPNTKSDIHDFKVAAKELGFVIIGHFSCEHQTGYIISIAKNKGCCDDRSISIAQKRLLKYNASLLEKKKSIKLEITSVCAILKNVMETGSFSFKKTPILTYDDKLGELVNTHSTDVFIEFSYHTLINFEKYLIASFFRRYGITFVDYSLSTWHFKL